MSGITHGWTSGTAADSSDVTPDNFNDHTGGLLNYDGGQDAISAHGSVGATETIDPADGNVHTLTLTEDCTLSITAPSGSGAATLDCG